MNETLLILTIGGQQKLLAEAITSLRDNLDILIVDDATPSISKIWQLYENRNIDLITKAEPRGVTDSWNIGFKYFIERRYKYAILSNDDVRFPQGFSIPLLEGLKEYDVVVPQTNRPGHQKEQRLPKELQEIANEENIDLIQSTLLEQYQDEMQLCRLIAKGSPHQSPSYFSGGFCQLLSYFNGFCFAFKRSMEQFMFSKDLLINPKKTNVDQEGDLCPRIQSNGGKIALCNASYVFHWKSMSVSATKNRQTLWREPKKRQPAHTILVITTTGDPEFVTPLFQSVIQNTIKPYTVVILKQGVPHPDATQFYAEWQQRCPEWKFLDGTDCMILTARNLGMLETFIPWNPDEPEQWFCEMDDDILLPPAWNRDMIRAAQGITDGAIFVPLLTFKGDMYYRDQIGLIPRRVRNMINKNKILQLNKWYSEHIATEIPTLRPCNLPEYCLIMRRGKFLLPLLWDIAYDVARQGSRSNEDLMLKVKHYGYSAWVVRSVLIFHRGVFRRKNNPKRAYAGPSLNDYLLQRWPKYKGRLLRKNCVSWGQEQKLKDAARNMARGISPEVWSDHEKEIRI